MKLSDTIIQELVNGILASLKDRAIRIILYGSVARNEDTPDSDIDIAVIINNTLDSESENSLSDFIVDMNLKYDKVFSVIDIDSNLFSSLSSISPFYKNVINEGIVLWNAA